MTAKKRAAEKQAKQIRRAEAVSRSRTISPKVRRVLRYQETDL